MAYRTHLFIAFSILFILTQAWANPTTPQQAEMAVRGWLQADNTPFGMELGKEVQQVVPYMGVDHETAYYIVYIKPSGFVIVPADDNIEPILGFVKEGVYDPSPENPLGALVTRDLGSRITAVRTLQELQDATAKAAAIASEAKWEQLIRLNEVDEGSVTTGLPSISDLRVGPLVQSKWGQTTCGTNPPLPCYNYYTPPYPHGDRNNYPCGCVATAMAQLMRYHEHPTAYIEPLVFSITVDGNSQQESTLGGDEAGGPYLWDNMIYEPNDSTTQDQRKAIGALCHDAGVSVNMSYTAGRSSASMSAVDDALVDTFLYSNAIDSGGGILIGKPLIDMINPNLDYAHPVLLCLVGPEPEHAIVCDGYGYNAGTLYHHFNMGWEGLYDAWYDFNTATSMPPGYDTVLECVYNIFVTGTGEIISGRVCDIYGIPVEGAIVTAERTGGETYQTTTNSRGIYALAPLPSSSTYTINVTKYCHSFYEQVVTTGTSVTGTLVSGNVWGVDFVPFGNDAIYVDTSATGNNTGTSWTNAFIYLQDAFAAAVSGKIILVAQGTYKPDQGGGQVPGDMYATFQLKNDVGIYGGFPSGGANSWKERDPNKYPTILSGDIGIADDSSDNSYRVVTGSNTNSTPILDGFIITCGNARTIQYGGAGMYTQFGSPTVINCTFTENQGQYGAGMSTRFSSTVVINCTFLKNQANSIFGGMGGGMYNVDSSPMIVGCLFSENDCVGRGGGMFNWHDCTPTIINCIFRANTGSSGGGMENYYRANPIIINSIFTGNEVIGYGGGVHSRTDSNPTLINCTFSGNTANLNGGGISSLDSTCSPTLVNCVLWGNTDSSGSGEIAQIRGGIPVVSFSCIQDDDPNDGYISFGGVANHNIDDNPWLVDADGPDNTYGTADDNLRLSFGSPCVDAGDNTAVPLDIADLDNDGNITTERIPIDLDGYERFLDDLHVADTGLPALPDYPKVIDMGAYEFPVCGDARHPYPRSDLNHDCYVSLPDLAIMALDWLMCSAPECE